VVATKGPPVEAFGAAVVAFGAAVVAFGAPAIGATAQGFAGTTGFTVGTAFVGTGVVVCVATGLGMLTGAHGFRAQHCF